MHALPAPQGLLVAHGLFALQGDVPAQGLHPYEPQGLQLTAEQGVVPAAQGLPAAQAALQFAAKVCTAFGAATGLVGADAACTLVLIKTAAAAVATTSFLMIEFSISSDSERMFAF